MTSISATKTGYFIDSDVVFMHRFEQILKNPDCFNYAYRMGEQYRVKKSSRKIKIEEASYAFPFSIPSRRVRNPLRTPLDEYFRPSIFVI